MDYRKLFCPARCDDGAIWAASPRAGLSSKVEASVLFPLAKKIIFKFCALDLATRVVTPDQAYSASKFFTAYHSCRLHALVSLPALISLQIILPPAAKMDSTPLSRADSLPLAALLGAVDVVSPRRAAQAAALAAASPPSANRRRRRFAG